MITVSVGEKNGFWRSILSEKVLCGFADVICMPFRARIHQHPVAAAFHGITVHHSHGNPQNTGSNLKVFRHDHTSALYCAHFFLSSTSSCALVPGCFIQLTSG